MRDTNIFKVELEKQVVVIQAMIVLLDASRPDLLSPLWDSLSEWINHIDEGLESGLIQFK